MDGVVTGTVTQMVDKEGGGMELVQGRRREGQQDAGRVQDSGPIEQTAPSVPERRVEGVVGWLLGLITRRNASGERRSLKVLETLSLGGRRQVMLVSCAGERYLVGMGSDSVETIVRVGENVKKAPEAACL